jgi:hypothetical protein
VSRTETMVALSTQTERTRIALDLGVEESQPPRRSGARRRAIK